MSELLVSSLFWLNEFSCYNERLNWKGSFQTFWWKLSYFLSNYKESCGNRFFCCCFIIFSIVAYLVFYDHTIISIIFLEHWKLRQIWIKLIVTSGYTCEPKRQGDSVGYTSNLGTLRPKRYKYKFLLTIYHLCNPGKFI